MSRTEKCCCPDLYSDIIAVKVPGLSDELDRSYVAGCEVISSGNSQVEKHLSTQKILYFL